MSLYEELKAFVPTKRIDHREHVLEDEKELAALLASKKLALTKIDESNSLFSESMKDQYELLDIDGENKIITHYRLKTASKEDSVNISNMIAEYVLTGQISQNEDVNTDAHLFPLPIYTIESVGNKQGTVVKMKNGHKALIVDDNVIEGVLL